MKATPNFKLKKSTKRMAANFLDTHKKGAYIRMMIQAQLNEEEAIRKPLKIKDKDMKE